jgi:hypothetical protein
LGKGKANSNTRDHEEIMSVVSFNFAEFHENNWIEATTTTSKKTTTKINTTESTTTTTKSKSQTHQSSIQSVEQESFLLLAFFTIHD